MEGGKEHDGRTEGKKKRDPDHDPAYRTCPAPASYNGCC